MSALSSKLIRTLVTALMLTVCAFAGDTIPSSIPTTKPESKEFTFVGHYDYVERAYTPAVVLPRMTKTPDFTSSAEDALMSMYSAIDSLDYDWWLSCWDAAAQKKITERAKNSGETKQQWRTEWTPRAGKTRVVLTRWIMTGKYVVLAYRLSSVNDKLGAPPESVMAFRLWNGNWRATLNLENDPVLQHFADTKNRFEQVVRP